MANPFTKGWKYLKATLDQAVDSNADPTVLINQAVEEAHKAHSDIASHAATLTGTVRTLEMKLERLRGDQQRLTDNTRSALQQASAAADAGNTQQAAQLENTATVAATQLVNVEEELQRVTEEHRQATAAAAEAQRLYKESEQRLRQQLDEAEQLRLQAQQSSLQEKANQANAADGAGFGAGVGAGGGAPGLDPATPTLDEVRARIEQRYATALGKQELLQSTGQQSIDSVIQDQQDQRAAQRLEEIRKQLGN